jgi:hypothetical protein
MTAMSRLTSMRTMLRGGIALALIGIAGPAMADEIYAEEWDQVHDLTLSAIDSDLLGGVVAQPVESAWQSFDVPTTDELSDEQESELQQLRSGDIEYVVAIPPEEQEEGGPTTKIVTAPTAFGGLDDMVEILTGGQSGLPSSNFQSTNVGDLATGGFIQDNLGGGMMGNSALTDALTGFQPQ